MVLLLLLKSIVWIVVLLSIFAFLMLFERKFLGYFQLRLGPNRTGPWGLLQPVADAMKIIIKDDIMPLEADRNTSKLTAITRMLLALAAFGRTIELSIVNPNAGVLLLFATTSLGVYGITLGGWASQSKYSLLGALRSTAQMISYELSLGLSIIGVLILAGSLNLYDIVQAQERVWFVLLNPVGFLIFFISMFAETNRVPFDLPEAETELVSGYSTEYSGMRFGMFMIAEYINMITMSA